MEVEHLPLGRIICASWITRPGDGGDGLDVGQLPVGGCGSDRGSSWRRRSIVAIAIALQAGIAGDGIEFIGDIADDFLQDILQRDPGPAARLL